MAGLRANFPDPVIGFPPMPHRLLDQLLDDRPQPPVEPVARLHVQVERVEHRTPHVVLSLCVGRVPDADRPSAFVAVQVVEGLLGDIPFAIHLVHDLQFLVSFSEVGDKPEEVVGLPVEPQRV